MEFHKFEDMYIRREMIYKAIYVLPVGELRRELIICSADSKAAAYCALIL